ncbi:hypothetical protein KIW84_021714 [Lathyrus oleraceus]|uniref:O-methyltransferase C-terminal domain-containing protein n=1 Tax=Pisum sativum TaxID=3888 RepID=A0A9D4Y8X9_PEA|nr:hypothetical protein KIW84_021714 [Pisum sativum]
MLSPIMTNPWHQMFIWLKNEDSSAFETTHGRYFWDYAAHDPIFNRLFNESMESDARLVSDLLIDKCKGVFHGLESLVDVAGGTGTMAKALAKSFPQMECIVFDLPHVVDGLQGSHNLSYVGGDMFQQIPQADAILLKWILHDWNDRECVNILKKCKESLEKKGKFSVILSRNKSQEGFSRVEQFFSSRQVAFRSQSLLVIIPKTSFFPNNVIDIPTEFPLEVSLAKLHELTKRVSYQQDSLEKYPQQHYPQQVSSR